MINSHRFAVTCVRLTAAALGGAVVSAVVAHALAAQVTGVVSAEIAAKLNAQITSITVAAYYILLGSFAFQSGVKTWGIVYDMAPWKVCLLHAGLMALYAGALTALFAANGFFAGAYFLAIAGGTECSISVVKAVYLKCFVPQLAYHPELPSPVSQDHATAFTGHSYRL